MVFRAKKFFPGDRRFFHGSEFGDGEVNDLADGFLGGACIDAENARIGVRSELAENGVGESLLFTDVLEQARRHTTAEKIVEDRGGEAAIIGEGNRRDAEADMDLLEVALGFETNRSGGGGSRVVGIEMGSRQAAKFFFDEIKNFLVGDVASGGDQKMVGRKPVLETVAQGGAVEFSHGIRRSEDRTAQRMLRPKTAGGKVMGGGFGGVHVHPYLFWDPLAV